jgi:hypothetical protein
MQFITKKVKPELTVNGARKERDCIRWKPIVIVVQVEGRSKSKEDPLLIVEELKAKN